MGEHYKLKRNTEGLTAQERKVAKLVTSPPSFTQIGVSAGITKQRAYQITLKLVEKGVLRKEGDRYVKVEPSTEAHTE